MVACVAGLVRSAIEKAEEELQSLQKAIPEHSNKQLTRVIRMIPRAAEFLRELIQSGNGGLRDPSSIVKGRNVFYMECLEGGSDFDRASLSQAKSLA